MPPRVLSTLTYYHPHWTGLTVHAQRIAEGLAARGWPVTVLAHRHAPTLAADEVVNGVRVVRVEPMARISRGMLSPGYVAAATRLARQHDIIVANTPMMESLAVALACRAAQRPLVVAHHGDLVMPAGAAHRLVELATTAMMRAALHRADRVTTYSDDYGEHSDFLLPFRPKLVAIPPPVDIPEANRAAAAAWRRELGLDGARVVGFAGRFVEEKGFDVLLRALPALIAAEPRVHLVFAGEHRVVYERFYDQCRPLLDTHRARITFVGLLHDPARLANFYALCDVFALPSRSDCFAMVQVEAMLCGTPVVATDIPGARVPVRQTGMGRLVPAEDAATLAAGLAEVLGHRDRFVRPRAAIAAAFDRARAVDRYAALFEEVATRSAPRPRPPGPTLPAAPALSATDRVTLEPLLRNESDLAFRRRLLRLLAYLDLRDDERVLDAGCGMGFHLVAMQQLRRLRVMGVDAERPRLARAHREAPAVPLLEADVRHLPFTDGAFDKILLSEVLEHVDDDRAVLAELFRILRPGGILAVSVPHANFPWLWDPINRAWAALGGRPLRTGPFVGIWSLHCRLYWPADLADRVRGAGFEVEAVEEATHSCMPFAHFAVYGIGKPLIESGLLPETIRHRVDRFGAAATAPGRLDPFAWAHSALDAIDRRNDGARRRRPRTFVNVLLSARRPSR